MGGFLSMGGLSRIISRRMAAFADQRTVVISDVKNMADYQE